MGAVLVFRSIRLISRLRNQEEFGFFLAVILFLSHWNQDVPAVLDSRLKRR